MTTLALSHSLEALVTSGAVNGVDISPTGDKAVYASSAGGRFKLYVIPVDGRSEPVHLDTGSQAATQPRWSPAGDVIAYLEDVGGDENYRICAINPHSGEIRDLTTRPGKLHENFSWSADGSKIAFVSNRDGQFDVYYVDVESGVVHRVTNHPAVHHSPEFSPDGKTISFSSNRTDMRSNWDTFVVDLATGTETKITEHEGEADEMSYYAGQRPVWSPDGSRVLVGSSLRGNYDIVAIDPKTHRRDWLADSPHDEINAQWSPDGSMLAYVVNDNGNDVIHVLDLATTETWPVSQPHGISGMLGMRGKGADYRWTPDNGQIIYGHNGPTEAGSVWIARVRDGKPKLLYSSMPSEIDKAKLASPRVVTYNSFDGVPVSGILYEPAGLSCPHPAIVMPHGGPTGQTMNGWTPVVQHLVSLGYSVFAPNFRGSTGYGREFQWMNRNDWGGGDLKDVLEAANWLEREGLATQIGIMGGSYGGYLTLAAITGYPARWSAAVDLFGITNLTTMYETSREDMKQFQERNIGTPDENPQLYRERSPLNHVDKITCPLLVLQGDRDPRVPESESQQLRARLEASGKTFEFVVYEDEGHGFVKLDNRLDYMRRVGEFLQRHMPAERG